MINKLKIIFIGIFLLAAFFRLYGVNWDQGQHLHPDERFLTMVANGISWPRDLTEYFDTQTSPLNPHNRGFGFYVYGTFPVFFTKWVAENLGLGDYGNLTIVGRELSAIVDLGTVILVFLIAKEIIKSKPSTHFAIFSMLLYSIMVLPIQLSHFFAVDTYLTFFVTLTFYLCSKLTKYQRYELNIKYLVLLAVIGTSFGLALASKISALLFFPVIILFFTYKSLRIYNFNLRTKIFNILYVFFIFNILFLISTYVIFRLAQPYAFANGNFVDPLPNPKVIENWKQLKSFEDPNSLYPPGVQWITSKPYLFPLKNMLLWGLGLPLGVIAIVSIGYGLWVVGCRFVINFKKKKFLQLTTYNLQLLLSLLWIIFLFAYQGMQFAKAMRYFHPIYPFLAIVSGYFIMQMINKFRVGLLVYWFIGLLVIIYPLSFLSIYSRPHTRVTASEWIYNNIPAGSTIAGEQWDDFLPLSLPTNGYIHEKYKGIEFMPYAADTRAKWMDFAARLEKTDYIILSSNRLYGSIMTVPDKYPVTYRYYQALFDGSLGFEKIAEFTERPSINLPLINICLTPPFSRYGIIALKSQECPQQGISFVDDYADESFTVYDHPKVIIFKKVRSADYFNLLYSVK